ncbi:MAG: class I SAM-dependent methyltransferase [bacterium]|nr:class I SAM-dependent methyltransferase [bacterium]
MNRFLKFFKYLKEKGVLWTFRYVFYCIGKRWDNKLCKLLIKIEQKNYIVGDWTLNAQKFTRAQNISAWNRWDWSEKGEEWTIDEKWKKELITKMIMPYTKNKGTFLEIGPGGGRWTEVLQPLANKLFLVDISEKCLSVCKDRFKHCKNIEYCLYDGRHLNFIKENSIDFIWSYDVFVHINPTDMDYLLRYFKKIIKKDGVAIIHHSGVGGREDGQRSDMTKEFFAYLVEKNGMRLISQSKEYVHFPGDVISVFSPV